MDNCVNWQIHDAKSFAYKTTTTHMSPRYILCMAYSIEHTVVKSFISHPDTHSKALVERKLSILTTLCGWRSFR